MRKIKLLKLDAVIKTVKTRTEVFAPQYEASIVT